MKKFFKNRPLMIGLSVVVVVLLVLIIVGSIRSCSKKDQALEDGPLYEVVTLTSQEPISVEGKASLLSDSSYYYDSDIGEIEEVLVNDGDQVAKGDVLFKYRVSGEVEYNLEDAKAEQTKLYNNRQALVKSLQQATGQMYNAQEDMLGGY